MTVRRALRSGFLSIEPFALVGGTCTECGLVTFPIRAICPRCASAEPANEDLLSTQGVIHSYTIVRQAPDGVEVPYVLAYIDLPEGVRLLSRLEVDHLEEVEIGMSVELVERTMDVTDDGVTLVGYQFTPIVGSSR